MRRRHLRGVAAVEREANSHPWSQSLFEGELELGDLRWYVVALSGATVVGFGGVMFTGHEAHVTNVAIANSHLRRGLATAVMTVLMAACREHGVSDVTLEVRVSNVAAQELYRRFGFAPGGIRPGYYSAPTEDAIIMWANDLAGSAMASRLGAVALPDGVVVDETATRPTIRS